MYEFQVNFSFNLNGMMSCIAELNCGSLNISVNLSMQTKLLTLLNCAHFYIFMASMSCLQRI